MRIIFFFRFLSFSLPLVLASICALFRAHSLHPLKFIWFVCENRRSCLAFKRDFFIILLFLFFFLYISNSFFRSLLASIWICICRTVQSTYIYPAIDWPANWHLKVPSWVANSLFAPLFYWQTFCYCVSLYISTRFIHKWDEYTCS